MTIFYMGASSAGAFSGLLAYAIGQLDGTWGYSGWRWIYCLEGQFLHFHHELQMTCLLIRSRSLLSAAIDRRFLCDIRYAIQSRIPHG